MMNAQIDYQNVRDLVQQYRERTKEYLQKAFSIGSDK